MAIIPAAKSLIGSFAKSILGRSLRKDGLGDRKNRQKLAARAFLEGYEPDPRLFAKGPDDAPDVFMPEPLVEPVDTYLPPQPQVPQLVPAGVAATPGEEVEYVVREVERINANVDAIALAMRANAEADAQYRQSIIQQQKDSLAERGSARSKRRSKRARGVRNFLKKRAEAGRDRVFSTFKGIKPNLLLFAALETIDQIKKNFDNLVTYLPEQLRNLLGVESNKTQLPVGTFSDGNIDDFMKRISGGEGGLDSYNTGTAGSQAGYTPPKPISQMTVGNIMDDQASGNLFAVGKYQITPETMKGFVKAMNIGKDQVFDEETQDKFGAYFINVKRPTVGKYLRGEGPSLEDALLATAAEFASVGVPRDMKKGEFVAYSPDLGGPVPSRDIKAGESLYTGYGGNAAQSGMMEDLSKLLKTLRTSSVLDNTLKFNTDKNLFDPSNQSDIPSFKEALDVGAAFDILPATMIDMRKKAEEMFQGGGGPSGDFDVSDVILDPSVNMSEYAAGIFGVE